MSVECPVEPLNAMTHQVRKNSPSPQSMPQVRANALMLSFIFKSPFVVIFYVCEKILPNRTMVVNISEIMQVDALIESLDLTKSFSAA